MPIARNIEIVREKTSAAARRAGREHSSVKILAVSKTKSVEDILEAIQAGQFRFGENYAQELEEKSDLLKAHNEIEWHFIGHLQKNKVKLITPIVSWIETIDSADLAEEINRRAIHPINCLIEVNIGGEKTKSGANKNEIPTLIHAINKLEMIKLKGLMTIPPFSENPEASRPYFKELKILLNKINNMEKGERPLTELSMGMSHDFEIAIEEGATIIRIGTAIFGERK